MNSNFNADIWFLYKGLTSGGQFNVSVNTTSQYFTFSNNLHQSVSCFGGNTALANEINSNPQSNESFSWYEEWIETAETHPNAMSFSTLSLWSLISFASDPDVSGRSDDVRNAYYWIVQNPPKIQTSASFLISSDWGKFTLITPSATLLPDPAHPIDPNIASQVTFTGSSISWSSGTHYVFGSDILIRFLIENDGSSVDIEISRGNDGVTRGDGLGDATAVFGDGTYDNKGPSNIPGTNAVTYYNCPVTEVSQTTGTLVLEDGEQTVLEL